MKKLLPFLFCAVISGAVPARGETKTAEFDFSANAYGFPEYVEAGDKAVPSNTVISEADASIVIGSLYTAWKAYWKVSELALCYEDESFLVFKTGNGAYMRSVSMTFTGGRCASGNNCFYTADRKTPLNPYSFDSSTGTGTLTVAASDCSELVWYCRTDDPMNVRKITITYEIADDISGIADVESGSCVVRAEGGRILVSGNPGAVEIYGISGSLLSRGVSEFACPRGLYIVKVDGKAQKLLVK